MSLTVKFIRCPVCDVRVKEHRLAKHLRKIHGDVKVEKINPPPQRSTPWKFAQNTIMDLDWTPFEPNAIQGPALEPHDPREHRVSLEKCPHGVLKSSFCAICEPDKFRSWMGID